MKSFLLLIIAIALASCNGFEHMHYRKMKKVPATGIAGAPSFHEKIISGRVHEFSRDTVTSLAVNNTKPASTTPTTETILYNKHGYDLPAPVKKEKRKLSCKTVKAKNFFQEKMPVQRRGDGSVFLVLLFLFLGFWLLITGIVMIVIGINAIIWWLILLGIVVAFLGVVPFLGMISFMLGDRFRPVPAYDEPQKTSGLPDHQ